MASPQWQDAISPTAIQSFRDNFKLLTMLLFEVEGTIILSESLDPYLGTRLNRETRRMLPKVDEEAIESTRRKLVNRRWRFDPLFRLFRGWAAAELKPIEEIYHEIKGEVIFTEHRTERPTYRRKLSKAIKDITALIAYKQTIHELVCLASIGDRQSLLKLVRLDKVFLTASVTKSWIWHAQGTGDREFFANLATALRYDTYEKHKETVTTGLACYLLWFLGFSKLDKQELFSFLKSEGICEYDDFDPFNQMLKRIGLIRYHRAKKVKE